MLTTCEPRKGVLVIFWMKIYSGIMMDKSCLFKKCFLDIIAAFLVVTIAGCAQDMSVSDDDNGHVSPLGCVYGVEEIHITGLTELKLESQDAAGSQLQVYLDLLDSFGIRIKSPGKFRFELYEFVPRSGQSRGKRLFMSKPDIVLFDAQANNKYWQDYLRSYVFSLKMEFRVVVGTEYILEVTCMTGDGKRITDTFQIRAQR